LAPRAIVLAGLPGTGKHSVARAIAGSIGRLPLPFTSFEGIDPATTLLVEELDR
jgi:DNA helicase TIP49 (TBP-interacting protein)